MFKIFDRLTKTIPILREMFTTRIFLSALCCKTNNNSTTVASTTTNAESGMITAGTTNNNNGPTTPATLREHTRLIVKMIDVVIKNLDVENAHRTDTGSNQFLKFFFCVIQQK